MFIMIENHINPSSGCVLDLVMSRYFDELPQDGLLVVNKGLYMLSPASGPWRVENISANGNR